MGEMAAMHYIVERIESDLLTANRNMVWRSAALVRGRPLIAPRMADASRPLVLQEAAPDVIARNSQGDIVRILDREGNVVWWREHRWRERGVKQHAEIMDDLMKMEAAAFRTKWGVIPERPTGAQPPPVEAAPTSSVPEGSALDPKGPWADDPPGAWGDDDIGWGEFGQG